MIPRSRRVAAALAALAASASPPLAQSASDHVIYLRHATGVAPACLWGVALSPYERGPSQPYTYCGVLGEVGDDGRVDVRVTHANPPPHGEAAPLPPDCLGGQNLTKLALARGMRVRVPFSCFDKPQS